MKNSFKRWTVCLISVCMATAVCGTLAACGEAIPLPDYEYDYTKPAEDFGDGIKIDGKPDEALYSEGRPIETVIRGTNAEYKMMTYFGENGVYFGWEVKDDAVAYHPSRDIYGNSGVELVVGPLDKSISYEIDLNACGKRMLRKWMGSNYLNWFGELDSAVVVNGEINGVTEGYTAELYLPYHLFNADGSDTKHDTLLVNPIFIRGYQDANSDNKLWYSIGEKERGLGWGAVQDNYYHFTKGVGLEANDVTLTSGGHGTITGAKYAISGDKYVVTVNADDGYFLQQLLFAGKDVTDKLEYLGGVATYTGVVSSAGNFEIEATFAALPSEKHTLSGQVTAEGQLTNARLYAVYSGALKEIPIGADGRYSAELAAAVWTVYCSADGYLTDYEDVDLTEDASYDIHLVTDYLQPDNPNFWNFERLGKGSVYAIDSDWLTAAMHKTLNGTKVFASANLVVKHAGDDVRAGFVFQTDNGLRISVVINAQRSDHSYGIQFINTKGSDGWGEWEIADIKITDPAEIALLNSTGMPMAVLYDGGKISIWLNGVFRGENTMKEDAARKYALTSETKVTPGIIVCSKDTEFHKLTFNTTGYEEGYPITLDKSGRGNVTVEGGKTTFTPGEKVTFNVTPADGYVCTGLTVNGSDCLADLHEGKLEYQTQEGITVLNVIATFTRAENNVSGKVTADGTGIEGIEVKLTASDGTTRTELTDAEGKFRFAEPVMGGQYTLTVNGTDSEHHNRSYTSSVQSVLIDEDKDFEIALTATAQLTPEDVYILDGNKEFYTLEGFTTDGVEYMSDGKHVGNNISGGKITYTYEGAVDPNSNHEIKTALRAEANDDFWVSANFRKQESFAMGENQRYGFVLRSDGWWIGATVIRNKGDGAMQFQFYHDWSGDGVSYWKSYTFNEADKAAWESEEGISLGVARVNKTYYLYLFRDGAWLKVFETTDYNGDGARVVDISVQIHTPNKGAELRDFTWIRGDIPVEINVTKKDHVSVSPERQDYALGDTVKLVFTPEAGMYPKSVKVDGEEKVSALTQNDEGNWVLEIENYLAKRTITVEAEFAESLVVSEATFRLTLHKLGLGEENRGNFTDGTSVTLDGLKTYQTTVQGGNAVFTMVDGGVYTLKIEGCADQTVEISNEQKEFTLTVEFNTLTTVDEAFVADEINDGKMTVNGLDGNKAIFAQTANSDEDFYYSAVISNVDLTDKDGGRIGFWIGCDRDWNDNGKPWDNGIWGNVSEALYTCLRLHGGDNNIKFEWPQSGTWERYTLDDTQRDAMKSDKGLRVGFARVQGKYYALAANADGTAMSLYLYDGANWAFDTVAEDKPMQLGFFTASGRSGAKVCDFTDMQLMIVKNGQPFGDPLVDKAFEVSLDADVEGATLTTEPTPARLCNFVMKFEPEEGKLPTEFIVDGQDRLDDLDQDDDGVSKIVFSDTADSDEDFYIAMVVSNLLMPTGTENVHFGFWIACDRDWDGSGNPYDCGLWGGVSEALYTAIHLDCKEGKIRLEWPQTHTIAEYDFCTEQCNAMKGDCGLRLGFARVQGKYYVLISNMEDTAMTLYLYDGDNSAFNDVAEGRPMHLGFFTAAGRDGAKICDFTDMQLIIVKNGQPFGDDLVDRAFKATPDAEVNVTFNLTLHKLGAGTDNKTTFASNTAVHLEGIYSYDGNVNSDGKAGFTQVKEGKYTLQIAGCLDQEVEIKADSSEISITVEYKLVLDQGGNFETQNINDGEAKYIGTTGESHMKLALESDTGDFYFAAIIKKDIAKLVGGDSGTEGFRYGFTVFSNQDGLNDVHFTLIGTDGNIAYSATNWVDIWPQQTLDDTVKTAWEGEGITFAVVRRGGTFYGLVKARDDWTKAVEFNNAAYASINLNMGLAGWKDITTNATFKNITFQTSIPDEVKTLVGQS